MPLRYKSITAKRVGYLCIQTPPLAGATGHERVDQRAYLLYRFHNFQKLLSHRCHFWQKLIFVEIH